MYLFSSEFVQRGLNYKYHPASILHKSTSDRHRPVSYPDGPSSARYRFTLTADWAEALDKKWQLLQKYLAANKRLYMAFVDMEKAFD